MSEETNIIETNADTQNKNYVQNGRLLSYAVGLAGQNISYAYTSGWLFYYLTSVLKIDSKIVGLMTGITRTWDSINDPLVGALVDKHRFKNGEKLRPYLIFTPVIIGLLAASMFIKTSSNLTVSIVIVFAAYLLWDLFYSFQDVALWGMVALSSPRAEERAKVSQWVSIGAGAGSTVVMAFPVLRSLLTNNLSWSDSKIFALFGIVFCLGGELISLFAYRMKEAIETPKSKESIFEAIFVLRHNKTLLLISLSRVLKDITATMLPWAYFFESRESFNFGFASFDGPTSQ
ncbi:MAG: MFS transporter, partial [Clostridia bacterium]|nr:MFS transporter [Clostridia bacterium]